MRDLSGGGLTYEVVTEELHTAATDVETVTDVAVEGTVESLLSLASTLGHPALQETLADFCARWDTGLSHLVRDSRDMADRLRACADAYSRDVDTTRATYQRLREGWVPTPTRPPSWQTLGRDTGNPLAPG